MSEQERYWEVEGNSEEGSPGERCGFGLTLQEDGSIVMVAWMEHATDRAQLTIPADEVPSLLGAFAATPQEQP